MSGIISAEPFNTVFPETKDDSTMQGLVTAIYEVGMLLHLIFQCSKELFVDARRLFHGGRLHSLVR